MKVTINRAEILAKMNLVRQVVPSKATIDILYCVKLSNKEIVASDNENALSIKTNIDGENFEVCVDAKKFNEALSKIKDETLELSIDNNVMTIKYKRGEISIPTYDVNEYPAVLNVEKANSITMPIGDLQRMINKTIKCTANDDLRPVMNGIFVNADKENLFLVASDGHRLVATRTEVKSDESFSFILSQKAASIILKMPNMGDVEIYADEKNSVVDIDGVKLTSRLIEGRYPNWQSVIPKNNTIFITTDRRELIDTINRISIATNASSNLCVLDIHESGRMVVSAQDLDFATSASENVDIDGNGNIRIGFKAEFLLLLLNNLTSDKVRLEMTDQTRAMLLKPDNDSDKSVELLMPMMIN